MESWSNRKILSTKLFCPKLRPRPKLTEEVCCQLCSFNSGQNFETLDAIIDYGPFPMDFGKLGLEKFHCDFEGSGCRRMVGGVFALLCLSGRSGRSERVGLVTLATERDGRLSA